jgi:hypothetical protein
MCKGHTNWLLTALLISLPFLDAMKQTSLEKRVRRIVTEVLSDLDFLEVAMDRPSQEQEVNVCEHFKATCRATAEEV